MDLFEYQAKELFAKHGVPTSAGRVTDTVAGAREIAEEIGKPVMIKAQVKVGGRGKAGGVKYSPDVDAAVANAEAILGLDIKGHVVKKLLVAEASDIAEEYYISFLLDRTNRTYLAMCSVEGGVEIEVTAEENPDALAKIPVDAVKGVDLAFARSIAEAGKLPAEVLDAAAVTIQKLWEVFINEDALLVEVNPSFARLPTRSSPSTARSPSTRTQRSVSPATRHSRIATQPIPSSSRPRKTTSTTSSSTVRSESSATAQALSCPRWTSSHTPARTTVA